MLIPSTGEALRIAMVGCRGIPTTYGGVERAVEEVSVRLVQRGHVVTVYARPGYTDRSLRDHRGVRLHHLPCIDTKHLEAFTHTGLSVAHALTSRRFDLIHIHATGPALFSPLPVLARVPCVATIQGLDWQREKWGRFASGVLQVGARMAATVPDATIVVSKELERIMRTRFGGDPIYIPNGVNPAERTEEPIAELAGEEFLLFLGRLVPEKGLHTLIEAFRQVETNALLVIAGPSSHSDDYVETLRRLAGPDRRIRLIGSRYGGEKSWLFRHATAVVQPSTVEGLPITLLEAIAEGAFPIVSDIPEHLEVLGSNGARYGAVFRATDVADLAAKLRGTLVRTDASAAADSARRAVRRTYDWDAIALATERVYRDVVRRQAHVASAGLSPA